MMKFISKTLRSLLLIGMGVQILLGLTWICCNIVPGCLAEETVLYEKAAETMIMDEYIGVLYPLLIRFSQIVMGLLGLPYESFLYLLQLGMALFSSYAFVRLCRIPSQRAKWENCFAGLFLVTVPLCVQWHLTILPRSFAASLYLLLLGLCVRGILQKTVRSRSWWYQICGLWAVLTVLMPQYWWFGLLPVIVAAVLYIKANGRAGIVKMIVAMVLATALSCGINQAVQVPGSGGRIQNTVGAALVSRFVWPHFETDYFFWPDEVKQVMDEMEARTISMNADNVSKIFGPLVEKTYGREKADKFYWDMALQCFNVRTKEVMQPVVEDLVAYIGAPWSVKQQLDGAGLSYSGWNYGNMKENSPALTRWYVDYGLVSFRIEFLLAVMMGILQMWKNCKKSRKLWISACSLPIICALFQTVWYTMSGAGMMDYGNVPVLILLWYMPVVFAGMLTEE